MEVTPSGGGFNGLLFDSKSIEVDSENGKPLIYCKFDCGMTEFALTKALENHLSGPVESIEEGK